MFGLLKKGKSKVKYPLKENKVYVGAGIDMLTEEMGRIYWENPTHQSICFGSAGSGKSELIARWTYEAILDNKQVFSIDPKGSKSWIEAFFKACYRKDILYDSEEGPVVLTLPYPEVSVKINPIAGMNPHQIASTVASGIPEGREPFFKNIAYEIVLTASLGLKAIGIQEIILSDIYKYLSISSIQELQKKVMTHTEGNVELRKDAKLALNNIAQYDPQYFPRVNSSLRTYLTRLITGNPGKILNVRAGNILWDRLEKGKLRFFAFLNAEAEMQVAYDVGRLLFANLLVYIGNQSQKLQTIEPQLRVFVDEATEVGFGELNKAIRLVRERNVSVNIFTQSPSGFAAAFGPNGRNIVTDIINSCGLRIALKLGSSEDRQYMSNLSPEVNKGQLMLHQNSMNLYYRKEKLIEPFDFESLDVGFGYAFMDKTVYYFYSPVVEKYDPLKCEIVFTDNPEEVNADVVVNMKEINREFADIPSEEINLEEDMPVVVEPEQTDKKNILVIIMERLARINYNVKTKTSFLNTDITRFYETYGNLFKYHREDFIRILTLIDLIQDTTKSVSNPNNPLSRINLVNHLLRTGVKAINLVKDNPDLTQEEREKVILASLAHDIGKVVPIEETYEQTDHEFATRQILEKIGINKDIVELAYSHHKKPEELGRLEKLLPFVKEADARARESENKMVDEEAINDEKLRKIDMKRVLNNLAAKLNTSIDVFTDASLRKIYINKNYIKEIIKSVSKVDVSDEELLKLFLNAKFIKLYKLKGPKKDFRGVYLLINDTDVINNFINFANIPRNALLARKIQVKELAGQFVEEDV